MAIGCHEELGVWRWTLYLLVVFSLLLVVIEPVACLSNPVSPSTSPPSTTATHQHTTIWDDQGVVSLASLGNASSKEQEILLVAGTKRGQLHLFQWDNAAASGKEQPWKHQGEIVDSAVASSQQTPTKSSAPYPIYSLLAYRDDTTTGAQQHLVCGSGDRFLTVWKKCSETGEWSQQQRLGPHTGWVKALAMDELSSTNGRSLLLLHSIGCNCIETWESSESSSGSHGGGGVARTWKHKTKRSIDSSPDQGSTLSSDLLCLSIWKEWLISGGVDGRLHIWSSNPYAAASSDKPLQSMAAHQGRVSALGVAPILWNNNQEACLVFSIGHDGVLQCRKFSQTAAAETNLLLGSIAIGDEDGTPARLTAMTCRWKDKNTAQILLGSATGSLHQIFVSSTTGWETCSLQEKGTNIALGADSTVYAISIASKEDFHYTLAVVGHSKGLSTVSWPKVS